MVDLKRVKPEHLWYVVGLIATDGNLSKDGRKINLTSKDESLLRSVKKALFINNKIGKKARGGETLKKYHYLHITDIKFFKYLVSIGLAPKKSLVLKSIDVPKKYFKDFLRGVIDGDGSIRGWKHATNNHMQWSLSIVSAAPIFSKWLKAEIESNFNVAGKLYNYHHKGKPNPINIIKFGKLAAKIILADIYYKDCLALDRKLKSSMKCLESKDGWSKFEAISTTV